MSLNFVLFVFTNFFKNCIKNNYKIKIFRDGFINKLKGELKKIKEEVEEAKIEKERLFSEVMISVHSYYNKI